MKKILLAANLLLLGIVLFLACNKKQKIIVSNPDCKACTGPCKDYSTIPLEGVISGDLLDTLSGAYFADERKSMMMVPSGPYRPDIPDTRRRIPQRDAISMFFDLEKLKNFIWRMERSVCSTGCDTALKLGVRFYYIKYDTMADYRKELKNLPDNYIGKHALAMVPVYRASNGNWYDFFFNPDITASGSCVFNQSIFDIDDGFRTVALLGGEGDGTNHGGIGPPPSPGTFPTIEED